MRLEIVGALTGDKVADYYQQLSSKLLIRGELELDMAGVTEVDSVSVALLVSLVKLARIKQCKLLFKSAPTSLQRLIAVTKLSGLLPVASS